VGNALSVQLSTRGSLVRSFSRFGLAVAPGLHRLEPLSLATRARGWPPSHTPTVAFCKESNRVMLSVEQRLGRGRVIGPVAQVLVWICQLRISFQFMERCVLLA
jgi:hypothetical protein